jgi:undecaprenyl-diphosphatase
MASGRSLSCPSGHATTAAMLAVALIVIAATLTWRAAAVLPGGLYAVVVAASRVYLGEHYPVDVLCGALCALAAGLVVTGLAALPARPGPGDGGGEGRRRCAAEHREPGPG